MNEDGSLLYKGDHERLDQFFKLEDLGKFKVKMKKEEIPDELKFNRDQVETPLAKK